MVENDSCIKHSAIILTAFALFFMTWYFNLGIRPFENSISNEELIFSGFVFGELFRTAHWGFLPAATLTASAFGSLHFYQGHDLTSALGAFGVTAAGSIFFSWIYVESGNNLWSVIWLHTLMNAPWILFSVSKSGAVGGLWANGLRLCTLLIATALIVIYKKRKSLPYHISKKTLIINRQYA